MRIPEYFTQNGEQIIIPAEQVVIEKDEETTYRILSKVPLELENVIGGTLGTTSELIYVPIINMCFLNFNHTGLAGLIPREETTVLFKFDEKYAPRYTQYFTLGTNDAGQLRVTSGGDVNVYITYVTTLARGAAFWQVK